MDSVGFSGPRTSYSVKQGRGSNCDMIDRAGINRSSGNRSPILSDIVE